MNKVPILIDNIQFELIFKPVGTDILTIELERVSKNDQNINLIKLFSLISEHTFIFLENNDFKKVGFLFSSGNSKWIDICQWIISKKIEGIWKLSRHPHSILVEKIS